MANLDKSFKALENKLDRIEKMGEKTVAKNYKKVLDDLRVSMSKLYEKYEIDGQLTMPEMQKYGRLQKIDKQVYKRIINLYSENSKAIRGTLKGITKDTYTNTISIVNGEVDNKIKSIVKDLPVADIVNENMAGLNWAERMGKHRSDLIYDLQKEIKQGLAEGDTYSTMTKRLKNRLEVDTSKANTIVRTESHRVKAKAKEDSFKKIEKTGVKFKKKWISSSDERVRNSHAEMDGIVVDRNEDFTLPDGTTTSQPGLSGTAKHDINCRCVTVLVLEE